MNKTKYVGLNMKKTNYFKHMMLLPLIMALLVFGNAWANDAIIADLTTKYPDLKDSTGALVECKTCHVNEVPIPPIADSTLKPNYQEAYNADTINYTGLVNLIQGCQGGGTVDPSRPWVCDGATPNPTPIQTPAPDPEPAATPTLCDDEANSTSCTGLINQYGSIGSDESSDEMTDRYMVKCGKKTKALRISVSDLAPENPATISIQAFKGYAKSPLSTDSVDGDGIYSRTVKLAQGSGTYLVKVKKSASAVAGAEIYDARIMCVSTRQLKVKSAISIKENQ
jgi:hypothetical protein